MTFTDLCDALLAAIYELLPPLPEGTERPTLSVEFPQTAAHGDLTVKVFALARPYRSNPAKIAADLAGALPTRCPELVKQASAAGGYLNLFVAPKVLFEMAVIPGLSDSFGTSQKNAGKTLIVEYASPNTNKPLHLGHIRNIVLGSSVSRLLEATGYRVVQANLVNDRGVHICKSMLAYQLDGSGETPQSTGIKGDHLVGKYYVAFAQKDKADKEAGVDTHIKRAQAMLQRWEANDSEVRDLWKMMNGWVLEGFDATFERLGVEFDRTDFESETYTLGRDVVTDGLGRGIFEQDDDGSVWLDLASIKLDRKIFQRSDGTTVYITQDIGTAITRQAQEGADGMIYVVGNEQEYHFRVLFEALKRLGHPWADNMQHLSYGMVGLPAGMGKMKSREGTTVDADNLMDEVLRREKELLAEREGGGPVLTDEALEDIAMAALKFFLLRVSPRKGLTFDPGASVSLEGDTGPYIQYTHTRVASIQRKAAERGITYDTADLGLLGNVHERSLARLLVDYPRVVAASADQLAPSLLANWLLDTAHEFGRWYNKSKVLNASEPELSAARIQLAQAVKTGISNGLGILGIVAPDRM